MKKQLVIIGIVAIFVSVILGGCSTQNNYENEDNNTINLEKKKFIGTWQNTTKGGAITLKFFSNGTCKFVSLFGTWALYGSVLVIERSDNYTQNYYYKFSNNEKTLSLTPSGNLTQVWTKQ